MKTTLAGVQVALGEQKVPGKAAFIDAAVAKLTDLERARVRCRPASRVFEFDSDDVADAPC